MRRHVAAPVLYDRFPGTTCSYLLKNVCYQDSSPSERRLAVADRRIGDDESPDHSFDRLMSQFRHGGYLKHDYTGVPIRPRRRSSGVVSSPPPALPRNARHDQSRQPGPHETLGDPHQHVARASGGGPRSRAAIGYIAAFLAGEPRNVVSSDGYTQ